MIQCLAGGERQEPASGAAAVWYLGFARLLDEALSRLLGDVPATATADGGCLALLLAARREAIVAPDETLSESTLHAIRSADSEVTAATFESLFAYIRNLKGLSPTVEIYRQQFEARVCALRAARLADAEPDGAARTQLTSRAVTVLKEVETAAPGGVQELIFNEPDLATLRQGPEFAASGIRLPGQ